MDALAPLLAQATRTKPLGPHATTYYFDAATRLDAAAYRAVYTNPRFSSGDFEVHATSDTFPPIETYTPLLITIFIDPRPVKVHSIRTTRIDR